MRTFKGYACQLGWSIRALFVTQEMIISQVELHYIDFRHIPMQV